MTIDDQIKDEKLQYVTNRESISLIISQKHQVWISYMWRNFTFNQKQITEQDQFIYSPLGKAFQK